MDRSFSFEVTDAPPHVSGTPAAGIECTVHPSGGHQSGGQLPAIDDPVAPPAARASSKTAVASFANYLGLLAARARSVRFATPMTAACILAASASLAVGAAVALDGPAFGKPKPEDGRAQLAAFERQEGAAISASEATDPGCPAGMARVDKTTCIDRFEAAVESADALAMNEDGTPAAHELLPPNQSVAGKHVRAVSLRGVVPQGYISGEEAQQACQNAGKRLCKMPEWRKACRGEGHHTYPYGDTRAEGACNDHARNPLSVVFRGAESTVYGSFDKMNDPRLHLVEGAVAKTGDHPECRGEAEVYDMVGNMHEWIDDPRGTFVGGYYQDTHQNGDGCGYTTDRHSFTYHDYSTGFRCCADASDDTNNDGQDNP